MKKHGFTLAEVLVTLGIIGVVAAMTIPTLVNQTNDAEYKTAMKKIVSVLNQAITLNYALNSIDFSDLTGETGETDGLAGLESVFHNRLSVLVETCDNKNNLGSGKGDACFTLNDGMYLAFNKTSTACTKANPCKVYVDVNGIKKPNRASEKISDDDQNVVGDRYVLNIAGQTVYPADSPAEYMMYGATNTNNVRREW